MGCGGGQYAVNDRLCLLSLQFPLAERNHLCFQATINGDQRGVRLTQGSDRTHHIRAGAVLILSSCHQDGLKDAFLWDSDI